MKKSSTIKLLLTTIAFSSLVVIIPLIDIFCNKPNQVPSDPVTFIDLKQGTDISGWTLNFDESKTYEGFYTNVPIFLINFDSAYILIDVAGTAAWRYHSNSSGSTLFYNPLSTSWPSASFVFPSDSKITSVMDFSLLTPVHADLYEFLSYQFLTPV